MAGRASLAAEWATLEKDRLTRLTLNSSEAGSLSNQRDTSLDAIGPNYSPSGINTLPLTCESSSPPTIGVPSSISSDIPSGPGLTGSSGQLGNESLTLGSITGTVFLREVDPAGLRPAAPGAKLDAGKVDVLRGAIQYFPNALKAIARVSELGAKKYSWKGWEKVPDGIRRYGAALVRHLVHDDAFAVDDGPGGLGAEVLHATQVAWNALARLELILKERG